MTISTWEVFDDDADVVEALDGHRSHPERSEGSA
jgi:hypothetical protein